MKIKKLLPCFIWLSGSLVCYPVARYVHMDAMKKYEWHKWDVQDRVFAIAISVSTSWLGVVGGIAYYGLNKIDFNKPANW